MLWRRVRLCNLFGVPVDVDASWLVVGLLLAGSLAGHLAVRHPELSGLSHWALGTVAAGGFVASLLLHEAAHAWTARAFGLAVARVELYVFGGVPVGSSEPPSVRGELAATAAGPLASLLAGLLLLVTWLVGIAEEWVGPLVSVIGHLAFLNFLLAAFNALPAFPLDGGRALRAVLWPVSGLTRATRTAAWIGSAGGALMMLLGVVAFVAGNTVGGTWNAVVGLFLHLAARSSQPAPQLRQALAGERVASFLTERPVSVPAEMPLDRFATQVLEGAPHAVYPVVEGERLLGWVTAERLRELPRETWSARTVAEIGEPATPDNTVGPATDVLEALSRMGRTGSARLLVAEEGRLLGVVTLKDLLRFLSARLELDPR